MILDATTWKLFPKWEAFSNTDCRKSKGVKPSNSVWDEGGGAPGGRWSKKLVMACDSSVLCVDEDVAVGPA